MMADIDMMGHSHILMAIIWLVVVGLGILLLATLFPKPSDKPDDTPKEPGDDLAGSAIQILKRRYVHGEITGEQYREMRHGLEHSRIIRKRIE